LNYYYYYYYYFVFEEKAYWGLTGKSDRKTSIGRSRLTLEEDNIKMDSKEIV
jgi:hypothetical protein